MSKVEKGKKGRKAGKRLFGPKTDGWMDAQTAWIGVFGRCLVFGLTEQVIRVARCMQRLCNTDCGQCDSHSGIEPV
jgi:hypothetical protein